MPATYAHYRFGQEVLQRLPGEIKDLIQEEKDLFYIGLHGPDILFYYHVIKENRVNRLGHDLHRQSGCVFFQNTEKVLKAHGDSPAYLAYVYGLLCHFALDRSCHGYIRKLAAKGELAHSEIEREFDRRLLVMDGYAPTAKSLTGHIHPSRKAAKVMADFYPDMTPGQARSALVSFVLINRLLLAPGRGKRAFLEKAAKLVGHYQEIHNMMIGIRPNPACTESNMEIGRRYLQAVPEALTLLEGFQDSAEGRRDRSGLYQYNFLGEKTGTA